MTAATQFAPTVPIPARARAVPAVLPLATVSVLHAPAEPAPITWRLTRRGVVVLTALVLAVGAALIWIARMSAPQQAAVTPPPAAVTVEPGDTLWSIATRVAPGTDPRAALAALQERNGLTSVEVVPGQVLQIP